MAWYLRKSFTIGPLRLNLSTGGLGYSVGVKGARVGIKPSGETYAHGGGTDYIFVVHSAAVRPQVRNADGRVAIIKNTFSEMAVVALTYLEGRDRAAFGATLHSGLRYAEEKFSNADARFVLHRPDRYEQFLGRVYNLHLLALYEDIKHPLSEAWRTVPPAGEPLGSERFVSHKNRFDERQLRGARRRWMEIDRRAEAVCTAASGLFLGELISLESSTFSDEGLRRDALSCLVVSLEEVRA